jgi:hypothetical protein
MNLIRLMRSWFVRRFLWMNRINQKKRDWWFLTYSEILKVP